MMAATYDCDRSASIAPSVLRRPTIAARADETPRHRTGMLATLEDGNACRQRGFVAVDALHEAPAAGRHVVDQLRLMQPQAIEVDDVHVGAQARHQPAAIRQTEKVGGFA